MHVSLVGVNYNATHIGLLEKLAISVPQLHNSLLELRRHIPHGIIISTCNRTEIYTLGEGPSVEEASINFLHTITGVSFADLLPHIYLHKNERAFGHLFRVASGLDSMIVGEFEVLGQVRRALEAAEKARMVNLPLRNLFRHAIRTGRRVRDETGISRNALSVSSVAVDLATEAVGDLTKCKILVIGAGEAGKLVAKTAMERGASQMVVASRSVERSSSLAETLGSEWTTTGDMGEELSSSDIVISCTGSPHTVLKRHHVETAMRSRPERPLVIVDIAVPRDVEPEISQMDNVFLYSIDDLTETAALNRKQREGEVRKAAKIINAEVDIFTTWWRALAAKPVISALMKKAEDIRRTQLEKTIKKLPALSDEERDNLEAMTEAIVTKLLSGPIRRLKKTGHNSNDYIQVISELFQLDMEKLD